MNTEQNPDKSEKALRIGSVGDMCLSHTPHLDDTYIKRHEWAEAQVEKGLEQKQCPKCKYWFFPCEF